MHERVFPLIALASWLLSNYTILSPRKHVWGCVSFDDVGVLVTFKLGDILKGHRFCQSGLPWTARLLSLKFTMIVPMAVRQCQWLILDIERHVSCEEHNQHETHIHQSQVKVSHTIHHTCHVTLDDEGEHEIDIARRQTLQRQISWQRSQTRKTRFRL